MGESDDVEWQWVYRNASKKATHARTHSTSSPDRLLDHTRRHTPRPMPSGLARVKKGREREEGMTGKRCDADAVGPIPRRGCSRHQDSSSSISSGDEDETDIMKVIATYMMKTKRRLNDKP